ncbi:MAG TPA: hypothetical protein VF474_10100 [Phenylobacterium sp.]
MSTDDDMRERHGRVLAELAAAGMAMVRRLGEAMARTDDVQTQAQLGLAFHRVSRAVRQTMALEFRLAQDARREDTGAVAPARAKPPAAAATPEPASPRAPAERTGWSEYESDDPDEALDALDALLEAEDFDLDAAHEAVEVCIARIRQDIAAGPALAKADVLESAATAPARVRTGGALTGPGPNDRRSELMGATALAWPLIAAPRPSALAWRSSA